MAASAIDSNHQSDREKQRAALSSVLAALFLTSMKVVIGILTGSLGILAEALHSGLDFVAAAMTLFAVRVSSRPADREHGYGHGKVENLSALFETVLLLVTCVWIIYEAVNRLFFKSVDIDPSIWAFGTMAISIIVDVSRSRMLYRVARKHESQALEADALHFSTDIWSSSVVLVGLSLVLLAERLHIPWLVKADAAAAMGVAAIVVWVSLQLGKRTVMALLDGVPASLPNEVRQAAGVPDVMEVKQVRVRRSGPEAFADLIVTVSRDMALERAHDIAGDVETAVRKVLPGADVVVHVEPAPSKSSSLLENVKLLAAKHGFSTHSIRVYDVLGNLSLETHLEVSESLNVEEAHKQAAAFERLLRQSLPRFTRIVTHIEPTGDHSITHQARPADETKVLEALKALPTEAGIRHRPHEVMIMREGGELAVSFHCVMDGDEAITDAHAVTEQIERVLRSRVPNLGRVLIHVEPPDAKEA